MKTLFKLGKQLWQQRYMIQIMAFREIQARYVGSAIGIFWSVVYPLLMVFVYWFIFSLGFRVQPNHGIPFVVWFFCAFVPWTTFNEMISASTSSVIVNQALIKRTVFPSEILPFVHVVASGVTHLIMLVLLWIMLWINHIPFSWYQLQFLYYWFLMIIGMVGFGWLIASINVFFRDVGQVLSVVLQLWFWATPVFWQLEMMPASYHRILKLNPFYYIIEGYRGSFLYQTPFWKDGAEGIYVWCVAIFMFFLGGFVFRKLKPHFGDVL